MEIGNSDIKLQIGSETFSLMKLHVEEGLSQPYRVAVYIIMLFTAAAKLLGEQATLKLATRNISDIITETNKQIIHLEKLIAQLKITCVIESILMQPMQIIADYLTKTMLIKTTDMINFVGNWVVKKT